LRHPPEDHWWNWAELRDKYPRVHAAVLNVSAWYDDNYGPEGATTNFNGLLAAGDEHTALLLGPWTHGEQEATKSGDRSFPRSSPIDYDDVVLRWLDHYVRDIDNGVDREPRVRYYVMGADEWRTSDRWPPLARQVVYYLGGHRTLSIDSVSTGVSAF